ncbi:MAG TPA: hypothetical protein VFS12_16955 [Terriglobia bacterium]|nr:hypothetical protein [Terriglobia bacterium]
MTQDLDYYCRNLLVIKPKEAGLSLFHFNNAQKYLYYGIPEEQKKTDRRFAHTILDRGWKYCDENGIPVRQYILKARQMGVSTLCESRLFHRAHTRPGTNCLVVAQDDEATTGIFFMARTYYAYLPQVLRPQIRKSSARELLFQNPNGIGGLNSWLKTQTAGWKNIGRSKTLHHLHCSEVSFWPDAEAVVDGLFQAVPSKADTSILIETTAQGLGTWAYNAWLTAKEARNAGSTAAFEPVFIPWYILPEYATPVPKDIEFAPEDKDFKDEYGLTWEQVHWYKITLSAFEFGHPGNGMKFMQTEYPSNDFEPWKAAGQSAFPSSTIELIFKYQVRAPDKRFTVFSDKFVQDPNGSLRVWERPVAGRQYAIGVDTAHGLGQDYSVISVLAHPGCRQVAEWSSNEIGPKQLASVIEAIARWYNEAVVAVEVDGATGLLVNSTLNETYSNLYRWEYFDKQKNAETQKLGWQTTERTKGLLIDHANSLYSPEIKAVVRSENIAEEMRLLRMSPFSGSGLAQYVFMNHTGDHLMAWLIACMCLWRKIARYDAGNDDLQTHKVEIPRDPAFYDTKADAIFNGTALPEEYFGNQPYRENSWLSY